MKTSILVVALAAAVLLAPVAAAAPGGLVTPMTECVPNPEYSPWSDMVCCYVNLDFGPACTPP